MTSNETSGIGMLKYHLEFDSVTKSLSTIVEISFLVSKGMDTS
jgi:hypothetical protein